MACGVLPWGRRWAWLPASAGRASVLIVAGERRHVIRLWSQKRFLAAASAHSPVPGEPQEEGGDVSPAVGAGGSRAAIRELPVSAGVDPVGLGVEGAFASLTPPPAAPDAEQHRGADQRARCRQCGHDRRPSRAPRVNS